MLEGDMGGQAAPTPTADSAPPQEMPSIEDMTAHLQQARGGGAPESDPGGFDDPEELLEDPQDEQELTSEEPEEPEGEESELEEDAQDEPERPKRPSQTARLKEKLATSTREYEQLNETFGKQQDVLDEIHQENLRYRVEFQDLQFDFQEQQAYVKQLEEALERTTGWTPDPRDAEMREMRKQLRNAEREKQFQEQYAQQRQQMEQQRETDARTREFAGTVKDVARRFKVDPKKLARVALSERALSKDGMEGIARDLRSATPAGKAAGRQVQKNRNAVRSLRPNGQARSRARSAPDSSNNPFADIEASMLADIRAKRGREGR